MSDTTARRQLGAAAAFALVVAAGLWAGARLERPATASGVPLDPAAAVVATLRVRTAEGVVARLADAGRPTVVMVSSRNCTYCRQALADFVALAGGRPLPRLTVVTLEGAHDGEPMLTAAGLQGATLAGPATPAEAARFTFAIRGTPTFVALDAAGRPTRTMPGYLGRDALRPWVRVMTGERERVE